MIKKGNKIYITYQNRDKDFAEDLVKALRADYEISWVDPSIEPGTKDWLNAVENAIISANFIVSLFSSFYDSDKFNFNLYEIGMAWGSGVTQILIVLLTKIDISDVPSPIRTRKIVDVSGLSLFEAFKKISETLKQLQTDDLIDL